ncbi:reverse transcriptase domain-containing protein, partial [Tanacetum coccineum]
MVGAGHAVYTDRFHELSKLVPHLVTPESNRINRYIHGLVPEIRRMVRATEPSTIQCAILRAEALTDDAVRDEKLSKSGDKRKGDVYKGNLPKCAKCDGHHQEYVPCRTCFKCNRTDHFARDCRGVAIRAASVNVVNPKACYECERLDHLRNMCPRLNRAPGQVQNHPNQVLAIGGNNPNRGNNSNPTRGRAFLLGANEAKQNPNVVSGTFSLNNHFATVLFDSGADYSFVST